MSGFLIAEYIRQPTPEFSVGWLDKFKKRHGIKQRTNHGELSLVPVAAKGKMKLLR
ncbi:hypothetical protein K469DRAFT_614001 [Zopfia rhizophila CBS 207.26]|uniref:HTH CENPB-type domain-containing protein n=1 Tax=Zopfia rhizophila CBS 207.26 TaxID=1314779 RepID=A0A6A6DAD2_9PEZI|nr:hypothetical protein K469DRAFT_614001 [Zopfia rhizophila CBS 207.26]